MMGREFKADLSSTTSPFWSIALFSLALHDVWWVCCCSHVQTIHSTCIDFSLLLTHILFATHIKMNAGPRRASVSCAGRIRLEPARKAISSIPHVACPILIQNAERLPWWFAGVGEQCVHFAGREGSCFVFKKWIFASFKCKMIT